MNEREGRTARCPVCGEVGTPWAVVHDVEYRTSDESFDYFRCQACRVVFIDPAPIARLAEIYPSNYYAYAGDDGSLVQRVKSALDRRHFKRLLSSVPGEKLAALDVGGGDGWLLSMLRDVDARVAVTQVVDLDPGAEALARERGHEYFCGPIEEYAGDQRFDVVLLLNLIEHVADPRLVLQRLRARLNPGGVILVKTPNVDSLDARLFRNRDWGGYHCPRHWVLFDRDNLVAVARDAGLTTRQINYTQGAPFWTVSVLAALARRRLVRISPERPMVDHPLFGPLNAVFAVFDLVRARLGGHPSQLFAELVPTSSAD